MTSQTESRSTTSDERTPRVTTPGDTARAIASDAGDRMADAVGTVRSTVEVVGSRMPEVIDTVRDGAIEGAKTIQSMPDPTQRLLAAFSVGLGLGLSIAGAPRLLVIATLAPAMVVAATFISGPESGRKQGA
jgi:hypothetical protein